MLCKANTFLSAFNLQALDGISFSKGCYTGQETVARAKYRGINKRMLATVKGTLPAPVADGDEIVIERSVGENWRKAGDVLATFQYDDNTLLASIIVNNNLEQDVEFRLSSQPEKPPIACTSSLSAGRRVIDDQHSRLLSI